MVIRHGEPSDFIAGLNLTADPSRALELRRLFEVTHPDKAANPAQWDMHRASSLWVHSFSARCAELDVPVAEQLALVETVDPSLDVFHDHCLTDVLRRLGPDDDPDPVLARYRSSIAWQGHRVVLSQVAALGDVDAFVKRLRHCDSRQLKSQITRARAQLVRAVTKRDGVEAGIALTRHRQVRGLAVDVLTAHTETLAYDEVLDFFEEHPEHAEFPMPVLGLFLSWFAHESVRDLHTEDLLARLDAVDPKATYGEGRVRDVWLREVGLELTSKQQIRRCRTAMRTAREKKELRLHEETLSAQGRLVP